MKVVQARLRFVAILVGIAGAIYYWPTLKGRYEKWAHAGGQTQAADSDTEYFCPMHPQIIRDHPDTCPICFMPLSKRKKGESTDEPLPPGVVSRVRALFTRSEYVREPTDLNRLIRDLVRLMRVDGLCAVATTRRSSIGVGMSPPHRAPI